MALIGGFGGRLVIRATPLLARLGRGGIFTVAMAMCLALSAVAGALQLAAIVGVGMVPRGEVGVLVASVALARGVIETELYGVVVVMAIVTTVIAPPLLKMLFAGRPTEPRKEDRTTAIEGIGG